MSRESVNVIFILEFILLTRVEVSSEPRRATVFEYVSQSFTRSIHSAYTSIRSRKDDKIEQQFDLS